jgi:hypothetical protein
VQNRQDPLGVLARTQNTRLNLRIIQILALDRFTYGPSVGSSEQFGCAHFRHGVWVRRVTAAIPAPGLLRMGR